MFFIILSLTISVNNKSYSETGLEIPRYVSLKSNDANLRIGPSINYPISIKYITKNFPLKVKEEYKDWRKVSDFKNNEGWIHKSLIKSDRYAIIISKNNSHIFNTVNGKKIGEISNGSLIYLSKCKINWCLISKDNNKGWVEKKNMWGIKDSEKFNINILQNFIDYYYNSINLLENMLKK